MRIVLTGAPHSGKTSLAECLHKHNIHIIPEAALGVIQRLNQTMGHSTQIQWRERYNQLFHSWVFSQQIHNERDIDDDRINILDRCCFDAVAYMTLYGQPIPNTWLRYLAHYTVDHVFLLEPLQHYNSRHDTGRGEKQQTAIKIHNVLESTYQRMGYQVDYVKAMSISDRAHYVLDRIDQLLGFQDNNSSVTREN